jgi:hypothetical protein
VDRGPVLTNPGKRLVSSASGGNTIWYCAEGYIDAIQVGSTGSLAGSQHDASLGIGGSPISSLNNLESWWASDEPPPHIVQQL